MTTTPSSAVEQIAVRLWKADAEDSGAPASVAKGRTPAAFAEQSPETRAHWHKLARAALSLPDQPDAAKAIRATPTATPEYVGPFKIVDVGEIAEGVHGVVLDGDLDAIRRAAGLFGEPVHLCSAAPLVTEPSPARADGLRAAIQWVEKRRDDYVSEHGSYDPETGATEFPGNGDEYVGELEEIIEGLETLCPAAPAQSDERVVEALQPAFDSGETIGKEPSE